MEKSKGGGGGAEKVSLNYIFTLGLDMLQCNIIYIYMSWDYILLSTEGLT